MIIQLKNNISQEQQTILDQTLNHLQIPAYPVETQLGNYLICTPHDDFDIRQIGQIQGIKNVHRVNGTHKMVSRKWKV